MLFHMKQVQCGESDLKSISHVIEQGQKNLEPLPFVIFFHGGVRAVFREIHSHACAIGRISRNSEVSRANQESWEA